MDCSLPGSSVHGIFQARVLEWVAIAFSVQEISQVLFIKPRYNKVLYLILMNFNNIKQTKITKKKKKINKQKLKPGFPGSTTHSGG